MTDVEAAALLAEATAICKSLGFESIEAFEQYARENPDLTEAESVALYNRIVDKLRAAGLWKDD